MQAPYPWSLNKKGHVIKNSAAPHSQLMIGLINNLLKRSPGELLFKAHQEYRPFALILWILYGPAERRLVTGLVITPEKKVSIGRSRKRLISALLHRFSLGHLDLESQGKLKGLLGFAIANEPMFLNRLRR